MARTRRQEGEPIIIKKYANRRLYNTATSSYVTLEHLAEMIKQDEDFVVRDAKTGDDITRTVLTQIIFDKESKDKTMLPLPFLRQLIAMYGDGMQTMIPTYLQCAMEALTNNQEKVREAVVTGQGPQAFMPMMEDITRQNMKLFSDAMRMFNPAAEGGENAAAAARARADSQTHQKDEEIRALKEQLSRLQTQVDKLSG
ncbi:polyhydroxyalkanoate synthesis repressor PhaR [Yunchengibacter salinarum]|uniref:polyhydroxyalkanoate synthesis repressor PhaR n=1 Tax=Yunchengibacter salinarum TaxID=3133399 RepID=UPI0035B5FD3E